MKTYVYTAPPSIAHLALQMAKNLKPKRQLARHRRAEAKDQLQHSTSVPPVVTFPRYQLNVFPAHDFAIGWTIGGVTPFIAEYDALSDVVTPPVIFIAIAKIGLERPESASFEVQASTVDPGEGSFTPGFRFKREMGTSYLWMLEDLFVMMAYLHQFPSSGLGRPNFVPSLKSACRHTLKQLPFATQVVARQGIKATLAPAFIKGVQEYFKEHPPYDPRLSAGGGPDSRGPMGRFTARARESETSPKVLRP